MEEGDSRYGLNKINFLEDDVEDHAVSAQYSDGQLEDRDLLEFVEKHLTSREGYPDYYRAILQDLFSTTSLTSNTLWVENPVSGTFSAVTTGAAAQALSSNLDRSHLDDENRKLENAPKQGDGGDYPELGKKALLAPPNPVKVSANDAEDMQARKADEWALVTMEYRNFAFIRRLGFLVFQGLLAGFSVVALFIRTSSGGSDKDFLATYQPVANEIRRYFFVLSVLSLVGSIDYFFTTLSIVDARYSLVEYLSTSMTSKWLDFQKVILSTSMVVMALYSLAYLVTLIMARFDVTVYEKNDEKPTAGEDWTDLALEDSQFSDQLEQWQTLDQVRLAAVLLAWLGCCVLLWMDISRYSKLWVSLRSVRTTALAWMRRAKALEGGKELDSMSVGELKEVVTALEIGLQRSKGALALKEDMVTLQS